jgi:glutaminase
VSKPFALALALMDNGPEEVFNHIGMEPTGDSFNSLTKLETFSSLKPVNPLVNAGAITTTALIKGNSQSDKFRRLMGFVRELAGEEYVGFDEDVYLSERETGDRNRSIAYFLRDIGALHESVEDTLDLYFRQCSIEVDCRSLAKMATALAALGEGLIPVEYRRIIRTFMFTCGMYDASGEFAIKAGIPAKSGVSGGIMAVIPGQYGIATLGPSLDAKGNSVAGIAVLADLSRELNLYVF